MKSLKISRLLSKRDLRRAVFGLSVILGGISLAALTLFAHWVGSVRLAAAAAGLSLVFVLLILVFVVPPLARNASREAAQMNLPFEFTGGGAIVSGLIVIVGFSAWNTGNNLLFLVLSFLSAAMLVGFFAGTVSLKKLDVRMRFPETIFAGDETPVLVKIYNRKKLFPAVSVVAEVRGTEHEKSEISSDLRKILPKFIVKRLERPSLVRRTLDYFVYLPRGTDTESRTCHVFPNRGKFLIKDFELTTSFPFSFFRHRRRLPAKETELIVFPKLIPVDKELESLSLETGRLVANKRGSGQDLLALRDYQPNDDLRRIDWKATARSRHIIVREFSAEDDRKITVFLDTRIILSETEDFALDYKTPNDKDSPDQKESERFEKGVSIAASLIHRFTAEQAEIRLIIDDKVGEFGIGYRHMHGCLKQLAIIEPRLVSGMGENGLPVNAEEAMLERGASHSFIISSLDWNEITNEIVQDAYLVRF